MSDAARQELTDFVNRYGADLYRYALMLCRNPAMAEDLVQETFLRAWRSLHTLREPERAKSWLLTTLRREHARQYERIRPEFEDIEPDALPAAEKEDEAVIAGLRQAIFELPEIHREVLALQVLWGYSGAEIGELLGLPRATVNTRLFRARQYLRKVLDGGQVDLQGLSLSASDLAQLGRSAGRG